MQAGTPINPVHFVAILAQADVLFVPFDGLQTRLCQVAFNMAYIVIEVLAISGTTLRSIRILDSYLGRDLLDYVRGDAGPIQLLHGHRPMDMHISLAVQGITDGTQLTLVRLNISEQQQQTIIQRMHEGFSLNSEEMQILNTITDLRWDIFEAGLANLVLPTGLKTLTFGWRFNECLDNTTLPSGLQIVYT